MNTQTIFRGEGDDSTKTAGEGFQQARGEHFDKALAVCSRLLLGGTHVGDALQVALTQVATGFQAHHVTLFQIESYHADDNRGRWLACSKAEPCPYCRENRDWDFFRLLDDDIRRHLEQGQSCFLDIKQLPPDIQYDFCERRVERLAFAPLIVSGKWWGFLCVEASQTGMAVLPAQKSHLETVGALFSVFYERQDAVEGFHERKELSGALEMAGTVCHKLNQPMQVILGYASMVTSGDISEKDQIIEIVQLIEDETRQMGITTKNLMGITKNRGTE